MKHVGKFEDIKYVVFSGRSFMFKKLFDKMREALKSKIKGLNDDHIFYNPEVAKVSCLFGPIRSIKRNLKSTMIGFPLSINAIGKNSKSEDDNDELAKAISEALGNVLRKNKIIQFFRLCEENPNSIFTDLIKKYMNEGEKVKYDENRFFIISGNKYHPTRFCQKGNLLIYFDGNRFYLKSDDSCDELKMDILRANHSLMNESLFPYQKTK